MLLPLWTRLEKVQRRQILLRPRPPKAVVRPPREAVRPPREAVRPRKDLPRDLPRDLPKEETEM